MVGMGSAIDLKEIKRFEVTEVYSHPDAKVDIVFIHGLNGHPRDTWTAKNGVFWPTELLPATLKSVQARILVYGYNADVMVFGGSHSAGSDMIHQYAQTLVHNLAMERKIEEVSENPIIFVVHSLGGILVKRALELSNDVNDQNAEDNRSIFVSTYGIIFLGTPHLGSDSAKWGLILQRMVDIVVPRKIMHTDSTLLKTLQSNNERLQEINLHFLDIFQKFRICMAHEELETDFKGTKGLVVDQSSAAPMLPGVVYFGIAASHSDMCKYASKNSPGYMPVASTLKSWIQAEADPHTRDIYKVIKARWAFEKQTRRQMREAHAAEIRGDFSNTPHASTHANTPDPASLDNSMTLVKSIINISPEDDSTSEAPFFIKPPGFRPNSLFIGREAELAELDRMLFDKRKRSQGTSAVLIQCMPGGGKTHLAREYVYEYKDKFPGGIFWLRAKSQTELAAGFWDIAVCAALKNQLGAEDQNSAKDPQYFIRLVRRWLNRRRNWLMVLDGIHFDDSEAMKQFIPDSPATSLIYTSTERSATNDYHWMNPQIIRLPLLSAREAQQLLLRELDRKEPFSKEDLKHSMELVQSMGFLPIAIHAAAQRLKATDEPLGKAARSYASEPRLRGLAAYVAVVEQLKMLGAYEALNLMYIMCFFSQNIPVEMIHLGLSILDELRIPVRASEAYTGCVLNNTFKILNTFALIDRMEYEAKSPLESSQSSRSSHNMLADNIDVLRLHSVVQAFFADSLAEDEKMFEAWLERAVRVFCCSFDMASERITRKTNTGLIEDYRLYEIHGNRLKEHMNRHEKRMPMPEVHHMLNLRLALIKNEIERRTAESGAFITDAKNNVFQASIFDRTSSSSDTGPETPFDIRLQSQVSTWDLGPNKAQIESPISTLPLQASTRPLQPLPRSEFPLLTPADDPGYNSDYESTSTTIQPSQRTTDQGSESPASPNRPWQVVMPRRPRLKSRSNLSDHRTTRELERTRYRDSAGSFRAVGTIDPRAIHPRVNIVPAQGYDFAPAQGHVEHSSSRDQSRGRLSGHSSAEVALAHIAKNSPPPARGGGMIMNRGRSSSLRGVDRPERPRLVAGKPSYAAPVSQSTIDTIPGWRESRRSSTETQEATVGASTADRRRQSAATEALSRFQLEAIRQQASTQAPFMAMPPYPQTPQDEVPNPFARLPQLPQQFIEDTSAVMPEAYSETYVEPTTSFSTVHSSTTFPRNLSYDALSQIPSHQQNDFLSLSSPNILRRDSMYVPGHPELSQSGYTSQPMSRDPSGQSAQSLELNRRRASLAETEPMPRLPVFSPRIPPTSYQVHRLRDEWDGVEWEERGGRIVRRLSPRSRYAALGDRLVEWGVDENIPLRSNFNPAAPAFSPSGSIVQSFSNSPILPAGPADATSSNHSAATSVYPSPFTNQLPFASAQNPSFSSQTQGSPRFFHTAGSNNTSFHSPQASPLNSSFPSTSQQQRRSPQLVGEEPPVASDMDRRSSSAGVRVGKRVIEFGDFPEPVDYDAARERAERGRERLVREESAGREGLGIRGVR